MVEVKIPFDEDLHHRAEAAAHEHGLTLDQFIRSCVRGVISRRAEDPLFANLAVFRGDAPADLAQNHDEYLYGDKS
jgi:hypothetical protein